MLSAQAALSSIRLLPPLTVRNKRDELYNDILSMIKSMELQWKPDEVQGGTSSRTLQALRDVLWYIDGSHATLAERSCEVPELLWKFTGYNQPESHKHRKCQATSLSRDVLLAHSQLLAGDHDFTKFSVVPSVVLLTEIPEEFSGSWYSGQVFVMLKEGAFEPSSPARHSTELATIIEQRAANRHVLFIYSDGGPDHRVTYLSVKVALIALFVKLNLDYLCAARTAPYHSYRNPVERIMSILNLGLQAVALARQKMPDEMETEAARCNSLKTLRKVAERRPEFRSACLDSVAPAKVLLTDIVRRLELKEKKFEVFTAATQEELDTFWTSLLAVDAEFQLRYTDSISAKDVRPCLAEFLAHCCRQRHYFFDILKCGKSD